MGTPITQSNFPLAVAKLVATDFLAATIGNLVMGRLVTVRSVTQGSQRGDTVNIPIGAKQSTVTLAQGSTLTNQATNIGSAGIVLSTHRAAPFQLPDAASVVATPDVLTMYIDGAAKGMARDIEKDILSLAIQFTYNTVLGTNGTALTEAILDSAEQNLFTAEVPKSDLSIVVTGGDYGNIRQIPRFSEWRALGSESTANAAIKDGEILGPIKGGALVRSQYVLASSGNRNLFFHPQAIGLANAPLPPAGPGAVSTTVELGNYTMRLINGYIATALANQWSIDFLYGGAPIRQSFAQQMLS